MNLIEKLNKLDSHSRNIIQLKVAVTMGINFKDFNIFTAFAKSFRDAWDNVPANNRNVESLIEEIKN